MQQARPGADGTHGRVTKGTLGDGLEESGFSDVSQTNLLSCEQRLRGGISNLIPTYDTTLQVVSGSTQEDLLLLDGLLGCHFLFACVSSD